MGDVERAHQVHLDDLFEGVDAHAVEDHVAQNAGIVHHAVELAVGVDRHLDDLAGRDRFRDGFEIRDRRAAALLDFLDNFFGRRGIGAGAVGAPPGSLTTTLAPSAAHSSAISRPMPRPCAGDDDGLYLQ